MLKVTLCNKRQAVESHDRPHLEKTWNIKENVQNYTTAEIFLFILINF